MDLHFVTTETARAALINRAVGGLGAVYAGAALHLMKTQVVPTPTLGLGGITEADFPGYAAHPITWGATLVDPSSVASVDGGVATFEANANIATPETIYGAYLAANMSGNGALPDTLLGTAMFDTPVQISRPGDGLRIVPLIAYPDEA